MRALGILVAGKALDRSAMDRLGATALLIGAVDVGYGIRVLAGRHAVHAYRLS